MSSTYPEAIPIDFERADLFDMLDVCSSSELDALSFGVVRLNRELRVLAYNRREAALSGLDANRLLGKRFFSEVAPCMDNALVAERFRSGAELDIAIDYVLAFFLRPTPVTLRMLQSSAREWSYLCVQAR